MTRAGLILALFVPGLLAPDAPAQAGPLDAMQWERRVLLVFADAPDDPALAAQRALIAEDAEGFADRRLLLVTVIGDRAQGPAGAQPDAGALRARFGVDSGFSAVLIGLDGGAKARTSETPFTMPDLFSRIDRMPMRRRELEGRMDG